jgi:AcrR family transcriptional regulator
MADEKRPYRKRRRAELEAQTRHRITESAVELHGTLGPSRTSFSAVAEHAGVRRSTLYRHFPDEAALFTACSAHWLRANPLPDLASWAAISDPDQRLAHALNELYGYYRQTDQMLANLLRDEDTVPVVKQTFRAFRDYIAAARDLLVRGCKLRGQARERVLAATGHALAFQTWRSLTHEQALDDRQAAELMCGLVRAAVHSPRHERTPRAGQRARQG